jgi:uncharacterized repeat protein (TIGR01451 family)
MKLHIRAAAAVLVTLGGCVAPASATNTVRSGASSGCGKFAVCADIGGSFVKGPQTLTKGDVATYVFEVTNHGPDPANHITIRITVPAELKLVSYDTTHCNYDGGTRSLVCDYFVTLPAGRSFKMKARMRAASIGKHPLRWACGASTPADLNLKNNSGAYGVRTRHRI